MYFYSHNKKAPENALNSPLDWTTLDKYIRTEFKNLVLIPFF